MKRIKQWLSLLLIGSMLMAAGCAGKPVESSSGSSSKEESSSTPGSQANSSEEIPQLPTVATDLDSMGCRLIFPADLDDKIKNPNEPYQNDKVSEEITVEARKPESVKTDAYSFSDNYTYVCPRTMGGQDGKSAEEIYGMLFLQAASLETWESDDFSTTISGKKYSASDLEPYVVLKDTRCVVLNVTELAYGMPYKQMMKEVYLPKHRAEDVEYDWLYELDNYLTEHLPEIILSK